MTRYPAFIELKSLPPIADRTERFNAFGTPRPSKRPRIEVPDDAEHDDLARDDRVPDDDDCHEDSGCELNAEEESRGHRMREGGM